MPVDQIHIWRNTQAPKPHVQLYTDGACSGNSGPGGWGYILKHAGSGKSREASGAEPATTNKRMELMAVISGLEALHKSSRVEIWSDSQYVLNGLKEWMVGWKKNGWKTADKKPVKNVDLWQRLEEAAAKHKVSWRWVRGHSDHELNEQADALAREAVPRA